jgi:hypothetical protein
VARTRPTTLTLTAMRAAMAMMTADSLSQTLSMASEALA